MNKVALGLLAIPVSVVLALAAEGLGFQHSIPTPGVAIWLWLLGGKSPHGDAPIKGMGVWLTFDTPFCLAILSLAYVLIRRWRRSKQEPNEPSR
jgi:hypothetical protein